MLLPCRISNAAGLGCARWVILICAVLWMQRATATAVPAGDMPSNAPTLVSLTNFTASPPQSSPETNPAAPAAITPADDFEVRLANGRYLEKTGELDGAEQILVALLTSEAPDAVKASALFELGAVVRMKNDLPRAEAVNAQFAERWPNDPRIPEVLLRQGQIYRQMGLNNLALTKFYAVMTAALSLKSDRPDYYPGLVLEAQVEIAETHYLMGRFGEAADFYERLLKQNNPALNHPQAQFRLIRSLAAIGSNEEAAAQARDFLTRYPDATEQPEVRFHLAQTLKQLSQNNEALQQVLLLLREEKVKTQHHPELWAYWQQRAGNEVANQLYREGDYLRALDIYINLAQLDDAPTWQLPVKYQIGLTYERLQQPQKAIENYEEIFKLETAIGTNATPGQKAVFDMARWRAGFLGWERKAETTNVAVAASAVWPDNSTTNPPPEAVTP
jgi:tetratricopeptide (TPR) repeat protein